MAKAVQKKTPEIPIVGTSTLEDEKGNKIVEWKIRRNPPKSSKLDPILTAEEVRKALGANFPKVRYVKPRAMKNAEVLHVYPFSDHHVGAYCWAEEVGANYDVHISTQLLEKAMGYLLARAWSDRSPALLVFLGDFLHFDSLEAITPTNKNVLDSDSRFALVVRTAIGLMKYAIEAARQQHPHVHVIIEQGNHDPASSITIREALAMHYENAKAVTIDTKPGVFHYYEFGNNLLGSHHGHSVKLASLPQVMATDQAAAWGRTEHRLILTGHTHQDKVYDSPGCRVESFRILAPADAWAHQNGYRPYRTMRMLQIHRQFGEVARYTVTPEMLE